MLLGHDGLDDQQGGHHQHRGDDEADDHVLDQAGQNEADKGDASHGQRIGDLGEHMVQVVAVGTGRSHDGGIRDGGAVVAHNAAGAGRRQTDGAQHRLLIVVEYLDHDGGHDADGAPGGTGGEADGRADDEDHGGQELSQAAGAGHGADDEVGGVHAVAGQAAQRPGEGQDQDGGDHLDEALRHGLEGLLKANGAPQPVVHIGEHQSQHGTDSQARAGGGVRESGSERMVVAALGIEVAAGVDQADDAGGDQNHHGQDQVDNGGLALGAGLVVVSAGEGTLGGGEQVVLDLRVVLMGQHGTVVDVQDGDDHDHQQGQQAVVVPGDLGYKQLDSVDAVGLDVAGHGGSPGGHGSDHADGSSRGVDDVGQLGAGDLVGLGDGTHHGAHGQAVEVVVDEDQHAQQHGHQLCAAAGLNGLLGPAAERLGAAGLVHQVHHDAQYHQEHDDGDVAGVGHGGDDAVIAFHQLHQRLPGLEVADQQSAYQAAQEQRGIHFLADQGQHDGYNGGQQGPEGACERGGRAFHNDGSVLECEAEDRQQHHKDTQRNEIRYFGTFLFHVCDLPPHKLFSHHTCLLRYCQPLNVIFHYFNKL